MSCIFAVQVRQTCINITIEMRFFMLILDCFIAKI